MINPSFWRAANMKWTSLSSKCLEILAWFPVLHQQNPNKIPKHLRRKVQSRPRLNAIVPIRKPLVNCLYFCAGFRVNHQCSHWAFGVVEEGVQKKRNNYFWWMMDLQKGNKHRWWFLRIVFPQRVGKTSSFVQLGGSSITSKIAGLPVFFWMARHKRVKGNLSYIIYNYKVVLDQLSPTMIFQWYIWGPPVSWQTEVTYLAAKKIHLARKRKPNVPHLVS